MKKHNPIYDCHILAIKQILHRKTHREAEIRRKRAFYLVAVRG
jgi:hypothetical protein